MKNKIIIKALMEINWMEYAIMMIFLASLFSIIFGVSQFYIGYHNVDLVYNAQSLLAKQNKTIDNYYDIYTSDGKTMPLRKLYSVGLEQMNRGLIFVGLGALFLGLSIRNLEFNKR